MAGRREFELLFKIQASLGSGFNSSINGAMNATRQLSTELSRVDSISRKIDGFQRQSAALQANREKLAQLTEEHNRLQAEMSQTEQPTEALRQRMERNARQIEQTTSRIETQENRLGQLGDELREAGVDTARLSEENDRLSETYERLNRSRENLARIGQAQQQNAEAISKTKAQLGGTIGVIAATGAAIYAGPVKSAMAFESKMADVVKVVDGLKDGTTGELTQEYYKLEQELLDLSTKIPVTAGGLTEIAAAAGQAGIARNELVNFTEDAAKMGIAFDTTADQAGDWMAKWRTSFGLSQTEVVTLADKINYLGNTSAANALQISEIVTKVGPLGDVAGLANGEIAALGATLVSVGVSEDVAATGIKKVMTTMTAGSAATKRQADVLKTLGLSATDLAERMQTDAKGAILDFMAAIKKLPEAQQTAALKSYFGEESVAAIAPMLTKLGLLEENFNKVGDATRYAESMEAEYAARADTTENKVQLAKNSLSKLSVVIGKIFLPSVGQAAEKLSELVNKFSSWAQANPNVLNTILKVVTGLTAFTVAALSIKLAFLSITGGILMVRSAFARLMLLGATGGIKGLFVGLGAKLLPILAIVGAVALAIKLISGNLDEVRGWIQKTFGDSALAIFDKLSGVIQNIGTAIKGLFSSDISDISKGASSFIKLFGSGGGDLFLALKDSILQIKDILPVLVDQFTELASSLLPVIGAFIQQFLPLIAQSISTVLPMMLNMLSQILPLLGNMISAILPILIQLVQTLVPIVMQIIEIALPVLQQLLEALMPIVTQITEDILPVVIEMISMLVSTIQPLVETILPILQQLLQFLIPIIQVVADLFGNVLRVAIDSISGIINGLTVVLNGLITFITGVFTGNWKQAWEGVKSIFSGIWESIKSVCRGVMNGIITAINTVIKGLNRLKIPNWVHGIGGKGINIPLIPMLAKGSSYSPETFIAGEKGAELITNARGRKVFTAAQTGKIFENMNRAQGGDTTIVTMLPLLQSMLSAVQAGGIVVPPLQMAYAGARPSGIDAPSLHAGGGTSVVIHSAPVFHVGTDAQAEDINEILRQRDEELLKEFEERTKQKKEDERRRKYD